MIKGYCFTNLDGYETERWPKIFVAVPREGERVEAESGRSLKVVGVTHRMKEIHYNEGVRLRGDFEPVIVVELHK